MHQGRAQPDPAPSLVPVEIPLHFVGGTIPIEWLGASMRETHELGRRRTLMLGQLLELFGPIGLRGVALLSGRWWLDELPTMEAVRMGPWSIGGDVPPAFVVADLLGAVDGDWLRDVAQVAAAHEAWAVPSEAPRLARLQSAQPGLILDLGIAGRRSGLLVFALDPNVAGALDGLLAHPTLGWLALMLAGGLRSDVFRTHWEQLLPSVLPPAETSTEEPPVNPQEAMLAAARRLDRLCVQAASAFEVAAIGVFLPDPDDEIVVCVAGSGLQPHAFDGGVEGDTDLPPHVPFGVPAELSMGAVGPHRVAVRVIETTAELAARQRELGAPEAFPGAAAWSPEAQEAAARGPWVHLVQQLPRALSPTGRNLVLRLDGRLLDPLWATEDERRRTSADRRTRLVALATRVQAELTGPLLQGLQAWRDGLRSQVLAELGAQARLPEVCRMLALGLSARVVSVFAVDGSTCTLAAWSLSVPSPPLETELAEMIHPREQRLLTAPLYLRAHEVPDDGFLRWPALEEALGAPLSNVGVVPIRAAGVTTGLLRVDGALSLLAGLLPKRGPQGELHRHTPVRCPAHLRPMLEELAQVLALVRLSGREKPSRFAGWSRWVRLVEAGEIDRVAARAYLDELHALAPTLGQAAQVVGVHRNTFRRHLSVVAATLGDGAVAW